MHVHCDYCDRHNYIPYPAYIGPIVGGVIGGILVLVCLIVIVVIALLFMRRQKTDEMKEDVVEMSGLQVRP